MARKSVNEGLQDFKQSMKDANVAKSTLFDYLKSTRMYLETGLPLEKEAVADYWKSQEQQGLITKRERIRRKAGVMAYLRFINGQSVMTDYGSVRQANLKARELWHGCDEDCFNCIYSDCLKPEYQDEGYLEKRTTITG